MPAFFYWQRNTLGRYGPVRAERRPGKPPEGTAPKVRGLRELTGPDVHLTLNQLALKYPEDYTEQVTEQVEPNTEHTDEDNAAYAATLPVNATPAPSHTTKEVTPSAELVVNAGVSERKTNSELKSLLSSAREQVPYGSIWEHRGGSVYTAQGAVMCSETALPLIIYHKDGVVWARPLENFLDRFRRVGPSHIQSVVV